MKIEHGIEMPPRRNSSSYKFAEMGVGDSFVVDRNDSKRAYSAASWWKRRHPGFDYAARAMKDTVRFWRTA